MGMGLWTHIYITNFGYKTDKFNVYDGIIFSIMATSFCLIAYGLKKGRYEDLLMLLGILSIPIGYIYEIEPFRFIGQTVGLTFMVIRSYQIIKNSYPVGTFFLGGNECLLPHVGKKYTPSRLSFIA